MSEWLDIFQHCYEPSVNGLIRVAWPDGGCYLGQEVLLVDMFDIIRDEIGRMKDG